MEEVGGLVPVDPHATEVVAQQVVQRIPREERQAVRNPVGLLGVVIVVGLGSLSQVADRLSSLLVGSGPHLQADAVKGVRGVLLQDKGVVYAVRLAAAGTNLDIVGKACLYFEVSGMIHWHIKSITAFCEANAEA